MSIFKTMQLAAAALALGLGAAGGHAWAQDVQPTPDTGFSPGQEVNPDGTPTGSTGDGVGQSYVLETQGAWEVRCIKTQDGFDPCQVYQLLKDENDNAVAEFSMVALPAKSEAAAGATIITPLETLLTGQLTMTVDGGKAKRYPFTWCSQVGCFARIGFTDAEVSQLKRGAKATISIVPMVAPDKKVNLNVSLSGFTAGYEKMKSTNEETQKKAEAAAAEAKTNGDAGGGDAAGTGDGN